MKQCPNCRTTYTDESLRFCLADGASLIAAADAPETVRMNFGERMRVNIPPDSSPTVLAASRQSPSPVKKSLLLPIIGIFGFLLLLAVGGFAAFIFLRPKITEKPVVTISPTPTVAPIISPVVSPTASNDETARLKKEMANLQKQIQEQKNQSKTNLNEPSLPPDSTANTARANSPRDGFLALRSEPNSETGYRVAKIPHGASVTVLGCPKPSNVGKMTGRWCQIVYNGQSGWAFDGFMIF